MGQAGFYVRLQLRGEQSSSGGSGSRGGASDAMSYLQDDHDGRKLLQLSGDESAYIARLGEGIKTDLEGGKIPLQGYGKLAGLDGSLLREKFDWDCQPHYKPKRGPSPKSGYMSLVMTPPKEVSLLCATNPEAARRAMHRAIGTTLDRCLGSNTSYSSVAAIHSRNANGEVHYHAHVLFSKFASAKDDPTKSWSLTARGIDDKAFKAEWKEAVIAEFKKEFGVTIEQREDGKAILHMPDGTSIHPLNRASRRELEKAIAPTYEIQTTDGTTKTVKLNLNVMDQKIYEVASLKKGKAGWDKGLFSEAFPGEVKRLGSFEKRVETLKGLGYLNEEGRITSAFRNHYEIKWGKDDPKLLLARNDLARGLRKASLEGRLKALGVTIEDLQPPTQTYDDWRGMVQIQLDDAKMRLVALDGRSKEELDGAQSLEDRAVIVLRVKEERATLEKEIDKLSTRLKVDAEPLDLKGEHRALASLEVKIKDLQEQHLATGLKAKSVEEKAWIDARFNKGISALQASHDRISSALSREAEDGKTKVVYTPNGDRETPFSKEAGRYVQSIGGAPMVQTPDYRTSELEALLRNEGVVLKEAVKTLEKERQASLKGGEVDISTIRDAFRDPLAALRESQAAMEQGTMELRMEAWTKMPEERKQEILASIRERIGMQADIKDLSFEMKVARMERWAQSWEAPTFTEQEAVHGIFDDREILLGSELNEVERTEILARYANKESGMGDQKGLASDTRLEALRERLTLDKEIRGLAHDTRAVKAERWEAIRDAKGDRMGTSLEFRTRIQAIDEKRCAFESRRVDTFFAGQEKNGLGSPVHKGSLQRLQVRQEIRGEREDLSSLRQVLTFDRADASRTALTRDAKEVVHSKFDIAEIRLAKDGLKLDMREIGSRGDLKEDEKADLRNKAEGRFQAVGKRQGFDREIREVRYQIEDLKNERRMAIQVRSGEGSREGIRAEFQKDLQGLGEKLDQLEVEKFRFEYGHRQWGHKIDSPGYLADLQSLQERQSIRAAREGLNAKMEVVIADRRALAGASLDRPGREGIHLDFDAKEMELAREARSLDYREIDSQRTLEEPEKDQAKAWADARVDAVEQRQGLDREVRSLDDQVEDTRERYHQRIMGSANYEDRAEIRGEQAVDLNRLIAARDELELKRYEMVVAARSERPTGVAIQDGREAILEIQGLKGELREVNGKLEDLKDNYYSSLRDGRTGGLQDMKREELETLGRARAIELKIIEARERTAKDPGSLRFDSERVMLESRHEAKSQQVRDRPETSRGTLADRLVRGAANNVGRRAMYLLTPELSAGRMAGMILPPEAMVAYRAVKYVVMAYRMLQEKPLNPERLENLRLGIKEVMREGGKDAQLLRPWKGREDALLVRMGERPGELNMGLSRAAKEAGFRAEKIGGRLMEAELQREPLRLSGRFEPYRERIEDINARFRAYGHAAPFTQESLEKLSPKGLTEILENKSLALMGGKDAAWSSQGASVVAGAHLAVVKMIGERMKDLILQKNMPQQGA